MARRSVHSSSPETVEPSGPIETPVRTMSLAESAAARIAREITSGALRPGQQLPPERDLAISFGLSRGALREGLRTLESVGLLRARVGQGRFVAMTGSDAPSVALNAWMQLQPIGDIIAVRRLLEPAAVLDMPATQIQPTARLTADILRQLRNAHARGANADATRLHAQFHLALIRFGSARLLRVLLGSLIEAANPAQQEIFLAQDAARYSIARHVQIQETLERGDIEAVAELVAEHLQPVFVYPQE
jgi:GntR family transcriptional regulator, transcriptional repressor for pyruvate dehydrogenase complex